MQKMSAFENILRSQFDIEVAQLDTVAMETSQAAFTQFDNDVLGGLNYIDSQRANMRPQDYDVVRQAYYQANLDNIIQNISSDNPYFGFADLETRTLKTEEEYLEEARRWLDPKDYQRLEEVIAIKELIGENQGEVDFEFVEDFNPTLVSDDPYVDFNSKVYRIANTNFAVANVSIIDDDVAIDNRVNGDLLNRTFEEQSGKRAAEVVEGDVVQYQGFYIYQDNQWRRLINIGMVETDEEGNVITPTSWRTDQTQSEEQQNEITQQFLLDANEEPIVNIKQDFLWGIEAITSQNLDIGYRAGREDTNQSNWISTIQEKARSGELTPGDVIDFNYGAGQDWFLFTGDGFIAIDNVNSNRASKLIEKGNKAWVNSTRIRSSNFALLLPPRLPE
jgi:hypothetical protein